MITKGKVVTLTYLLTNAEGEELDRAEAQDPFVYLHGSKQIISGLEEALENLAVGDKKEVTVSPADGYGERHDDLRMTLDISAFPKDVEVEADLEFEGTTQDGQRRVFVVESVENGQVVVDGNHPLAGETLNFKVEVVDVREASEEELEHGHVHGPDEHLH